MAYVSRNIHTMHIVHTIGAATSPYTCMFAKLLFPTILCADDDFIAARQPSLFLHLT